MEPAHTPTGPPRAAGPSFEQPLSPKTPHSAPDSSRRHSLPLHFLPPSLWSKNTSSVSLVESEEAARGEHILDEAAVAHRISALRQLNGATRSRHRYAKSTGARNSTFSQPVIVRTYSGTVRPPSQQRDIITKNKEKELSRRSTNKMDLKLPPVEAFSFKGIMDEIRHGVTEDLERIAEICARSKYSLSNQYEVHMPPHGRGEPYLQTITQASASVSSAGGPTLQAIGSDDEPPRYSGRTRGSRRTKSAAYGTLETIMSSSRSSDEDKSKKKPAAEIAEEVRGRAAKKDVLPSPEIQDEIAVEPEPQPQRPAKHVRSRSATFASIMMDNAHGSRNDTVLDLMSPTSLISEPARPQTSTAADFTVSTPFNTTFGDVAHKSLAYMPQTPAVIRNESKASAQRPEPGNIPGMLNSLNSWLPWKRSERRTTTNAVGSLKELLNSTDGDTKGKRVDRNG